MTLNNRLIIGLTGQSGAGKTTVCEFFSNNGFYVIDCDKISKLVTSEGSQCNKKLWEVFPSCFDGNFKMNRQKMAEEVFSDKCKLKKLDEIIYPYIWEQLNILIEKAAKSCNYILLDAPTLFESGVNEICNVIISVISCKANRLDRIILRDEISQEMALKRFSSQKPQEFFVENSDFIIENNGDIESLKISTEEIIKKLKEL